MNCYKLKRDHKIVSRGSWNDERSPGTRRKELLRREVQIRRRTNWLRGFSIDVSEVQNKIEAGYASAFPWFGDLTMTWLTMMESGTTSSRTSSHSNNNSCMGKPFSMEDFAVGGQDSLKESHLASLHLLSWKWNTESTVCSCYTIDENRDRAVSRELFHALNVTGSGQKLIMACLSVISSPCL